MSWRSRSSQPLGGPGHAERETPDPVVDPDDGEQAALGRLQVCPRGAPLPGERALDLEVPLVDAGLEQPATSSHGYEPGRRGRPWSGKRTWTVPLVGLPRAHLRHTCVWLWLGAGADPEVVQRIRGHASAAMTMDLHGHLTDQNLWDAAAKFGARKPLGAGMTEPQARNLASDLGL